MTTTPTLRRRLKAIEMKRTEDAKPTITFSIRVLESDDLFGPGVIVRIRDDGEEEADIIEVGD